MPFDRQQLRQLAAQIRQQAAGARTLDDFIGLVRRRMAENPMLQLKFYWRLPVWPEPDFLDRTLHRALVSLPEDGLAGEVVACDFGFVVPFRVGRQEGKGETLDQVRGEMEQRVREQRRKELVQEHLDALLDRYRAKKFYEHLLGQAAAGGPAF